MKRVAWCNGRPATADALGALAQANYGHFTSMQVRGGRVRGLDLHLQRLHASTRLLFDGDLDPAQLRSWLRDAVATAPDCALRVTVFARDFDFRRAAGAYAPDVLIVRGAPAALPDAPLRLRSCVYARAFAQIKHVGTFAQLWQRRLAARAGADDALFTTADGCISEGSLWNIGFWDGGSVCWPEAPALRGVTEQLLQAGLAAGGVASTVRPLRLDDVAGFRAAFACNAGGVRAIAAIDAHAWQAQDAPPMLAALAAALDTQPWQSICE